MNNAELARQVQTLRSLSKRAREACGHDVEMMSHWARYLCVLSAGFLEKSLAALYSDVCRQKAHTSVAKFAIRALDKISNPKTSRFLEIAGHFKEDWRNELEAFVVQDGRREAIDSIMANRHLIAHGDRSDVTLARVEAYLAKAIQVVEFVEQQCS